MRKFLLILLLANCFTLNAVERYVVKFDDCIVELSLYYAKSDVGIKETHGNNRGVELDAMLRRFGIKLGSPYCAIGQYDAYQRASEDLGVKNPMPKTAVANQIHSRLKALGKQTKFVARKDDFITWQYPNSWQGHIERIDSVMPGGWVRTIAYNVSAGRDLSNDGKDGVMYKRRNIYHPIARMRVRGLIGVRGI